ncbi:MAG: sugar-binding transcriptional regulator [Deinococcota bacterium]
MLEQDVLIRDALRVAKMYYYQDLTTPEIAQVLGLSRPKVSRLLSFAKDKGLVEVKIHDPNVHKLGLERDIQDRFELASVQVVHTPAHFAPRERLDLVAKFGARYLNTFIEDSRVLGLAWGTTLSAISSHLVPRACSSLDIVQLNGSGNTHNISNTYASEIMVRFANNYAARAHLLPVPTFFDYPETKAALWRERSLQRVTRLQDEADTLLFSIGAVSAGVPSKVYSSEYLEDTDWQGLAAQGVVGDIATVFFRADGSYADIEVNQRSSGPELELFRQARHSVCVVSGEGKVRGLHAALQGRYIRHLILDDVTAHVLLELVVD